MDKGGQGEKPRVVIDASVAAKWVIPGEPWDTEAEILKEKIVLGEVEAYAPELILYEVASVLLKSISIAALELSEGIEALKAMGDLGVNIQTAEWNDLAEILNVAAKTKLTVYDSTYLHLSKRIRGKLITADKELKEKGKAITETILLKDF
ncbi:MAG: type II toxin-antitoxin system VapC family toxin [Candidatus Bathyarchaeia archaeon]